MKMEDNDETTPKIIETSDILTAVKIFLKERDGRGLKKFVIDRKLSDETVYWDICTEVCVHLTEDNYVNCTIFFEACEMCLKYIVREGNAKEILLALLEQCEFFNDDIKYTSLLFLVQNTLLRLPNKRFHSLDLALETLTSHLLTYPLPSDNALENEERKLLSMCGEVVKLNNVLESFLQFLTPFVEEVSLKTCKLLHSENVQAQIMVLKIHLLKILNRPVIHIDLHFNMADKSSKTNSRVIIETLIDLLTHLETDFQKMMEYAVNKKPVTIELDHDFRKTEMEIENEENEKRLLGNVDGVVNSITKKTEIPSLRFNEIIPIHSLCCLSYLIHSEKLGIERFPCIYSTIYIFEFNLQFITEMLKTTQSLLLFKGLKLLESFVTVLPSNTLSSLQLDNNYYNELINHVIDIMVQCSVKDLRQEAIKLFTMFIKLFQANGRYQIYQNIMTNCKHSGVKGYVMTLVKDDIKDALNEDVPNMSFLGPRLERLLQLAVNLPDGESTDLLEHSDQIITVLNLLRYLVIRDPPQDNKTGIWNNLKEMGDKFFKLLRIGLEMSAAHYDLEKKNIMEGKNTVARETTEFNVSVGGVNLPPVQKNEKLLVINSALNTFDLMNSLLTRLTDIIEQKPSESMVSSDNV